MLSFLAVIALIVAAAIVVVTAILNPSQHTQNLSAPVLSLPLVASIDYKNILAMSSLYPTQHCYGYELFMQPETDKSGRMLPLGSVHLSVRFPKLVKDFRVAIGNGPYAAVSNQRGLGCGFVGTPLIDKTVNTNFSIQCFENEFSFDAHSLNEVLWAEFLTDEAAPTCLRALFLECQSQQHTLWERRNCGRSWRGRAKERVKSKPLFSMLESTQSPGIQALVAA